MSTCPQGHSSQSTDYCDVCGTPIPAGGSAQPAVPAAPAAPGSSSGTPPAAAAPDGLTCPNCAVQNLPDALFCEACGYDFTTGTMPRMPSEEDDTPTNEQPAVGLDGLPLTPPADGDAATPAPSSEEPADGSSAGSAAAAGSDEGPTGGGANPSSDAANAPDVPTATSPPALPAPTAAPAPEWVAEVWVDPDWYRTQNSPDPLPSPGLPDVVLLRESSILVGRMSQSRNIHPQIDCGNDSGVSRRHAQLTSDGRRWWAEDLQSSNGTFVAPASGPLPKTPVDPGERIELDPDDRVYVGGWTRMVIRRATDEEKAAS